MKRILYILGDVPVTLSCFQYLKTFTWKQRRHLRKNKTINWVDNEGNIHQVKLLKKRKKY